MDITNWLTPFKWGRPVWVGSGNPGAFDEQAVDCPFVFRHRDQFFMMYVGFDGKGYQTALATSDDLLNWQPYGIILRRGEGAEWDKRNTAGTWMLRDSRLHGPATLQKWDGKYWLAYHAYPGEGFESGPASIGLAWTTDENLFDWHRLPEPVLMPDDGADWESGGLYKECLLEHEGTLYLFYNAKNIADPHASGPHRWIEQTGYAVSQDMVSWTRMPHNPVLPVSPGRWDSIFASEPCVLHDGRHWVMYYFGFDGKHAQDGIAYSDDLVHWEKYSDPLLSIGQEGEIDSIHAHKPSLISHSGVLYHFYVACRPYQEGDATIIFGKEYRTISVATSANVQCETREEQE